MKFPKDEIITLNQINDLLTNQQEVDIPSLSNKIIEYIDFIIKHYPDVIDEYISKLFELRKFDHVINFVDELTKKGLENFNWYYYSLSSLIANNDIYYAKRIIANSKILQDQSLHFLINSEDADYNAIFNLHSTLLETAGPCLILVNFINELLYESLKTNITSDYLIMRFFDLLNLLFEYGVNEEIVKQFDKTVKIIYEIPID